MQAIRVRARAFGITQQNTRPSVHSSLPLSKKSTSSCTAGMGTFLSATLANTPYAERHGSVGLRRSWIRESKDEDVDTNVEIRSTVHSVGLKRTDTSIIVKGKSRPGLNLKVFPLLPDSNIKLAFDFLSALILASDLILVPLFVSWEKHFEGIFMITAWIAVAFWTSDLVLNFATCVVEDDTCVSSWKLIAYHYLKGWFVLHVVVLSCDYLFVLSSIAKSEEVYVMQIPVCFKMSRLLRVFEAMSKNELSQPFKQLKEVVVGLKQMRYGFDDELRVAGHVCMMMVVIVLANHYGSCVWHFVTRTSRDTCFGLQACGEEEESFGLSYVRGFYWSHTTMFAGDGFLVPSNFAEVTFSSIMVLVGAIMSAGVVASLSASLIDLGMIRREYTKQTTDLKMYLRQRRISPRLCVKIKNELRVRLLNVEKRLTENDVPSISLLSAELRFQLRVSLSAPALKKHFLLGVCNSLHDGLVLTLCGTCVTHKAMPLGEVLFYAGEHMQQAHLLLTGKLQYYIYGLPRSSKRGCSIHSSSTAGSVATESSVVTESSSTNVNFSTFKRARSQNQIVTGLQWLCEIALWSEWVTLGTAEAIDSIEYLSIDVTAFASVILEIGGDVGMLVCDYARAFTGYVQNEMPDEFDDLSLGADPDLALLLMRPASRKLISQSALKHLESTQRAKHGKDLQEEALVNSCVVRYDAALSNTLRVVQIVAIEFEREDGKILAQIGEWKNGLAIVRKDFFLPCRQIVRSESRRAAAQKLMCDDFLHLSFVCNLEFSHLDVEFTTSARHGIMTKYIRQVFRGQVDVGPDAALPIMIMPCPPLSKNQGIEVAIVKGCTACKLCAWLEADQIEILKKEHARSKDVVLQWVKEVAEEVTVTTQKGWGDLKEEVENGVSAISHGSGGRLRRDVHLVAMQLEQGDGRILAQLGKWKDGLARVRKDYFLPCSKMFPSETIHSAAERFYRKELFHRSLDCAPTFSHIDIEEIDSPSYGIPTRYKRMIFRGEVDACPDEALLTMMMPYPALSPDNAIEVVVVRASSSATPEYRLCAWLTESQIEVSRKSIRKIMPWCFNGCATLQRELHSPCARH